MMTEELRKQKPYANLYMYNVCMYIFVHTYISTYVCMHMTDAYWSDLTINMIKIMMIVVVRRRVIATYTH